MKFVFAQVIGMLGDQLAWWGEDLQNVSARITRAVTGIEAGDLDDVRIHKIFAYIDGPVTPTENGENTHE